ncbi:hypothetical protein C2845_PM10G14180 [Panicum miliaceum]|uniref:DUF8040 domain-containing protein n=1 Tax=Panicum miliaceum TaxID=4540 RepID=A0A3L6PED6_PANMI|nr:hypothetical protein C2845_PM10G14180 [Panicum miliaceum]
MKWAQQAAVAVGRPCPTTQWAQLAAVVVGRHSLGSVSAAGLASRGTSMCRGGGGLCGAISHGTVGGRPGSTLAWGAAELDGDDEMEQEDDIGYFQEEDGSAGGSQESQDEVQGEGQEEVQEEASSEDEGSGGVNADVLLMAQTRELLDRSQLRKRKLIMVASMIGTYYFDTYMNKSERRVATESGNDWVLRTLDKRTSCYNIFRMSRAVFNKLHNLLVESYGVESTQKMLLVEALGMFLWILGAPQSTRQAENRLVRSTETIRRKFEKVLSSVIKLATDIIRPVDPEFIQCMKGYSLLVFLHTLTIALGQ